jgi:hypothetical protein
VNDADNGDLTLTALRWRLRRLRDCAVEAYARATGLNKKLDGTVLVLSTLTAGSLWFLCASAGPAWLALTVKWLGAIFATVCAILTAYKEKITNHKKLADEAIKHVQVLEELIGRSQERQTEQSLQALNAAYRTAKAAMASVVLDLGLEPSTSELVNIQELIAGSRSSTSANRGGADSDS